jgi:PAS domain S-box-containing protein
MLSLKRTILIAGILLIAVLLFNIFGYYYIGNKYAQQKKREEAEKLASSQQVLIHQATNSAYVAFIHHSFTESQYGVQVARVQSFFSRLDSSHKALSQILAEDGFDSGSPDEKHRQIFSAVSIQFDSISHIFNRVLRSEKRSDSYLYRSGLKEAEQRYVAALQELTEELRHWEERLSSEIMVMNRFIIITLIVALVFLTIVIIAPIFRQSIRNYNNLQASLAEIKKSEALLRTVIDSTPDLIYVKDREHRFRLVNKAMAAESGKAPRDFIGKTELDFGLSEELVYGNPEKCIKGLREDSERVMQTGEAIHIPEEEICINGRTKVVSAVKVPLRSHDGGIWGVLCYIHDITDRVMAEKKLQESEQKYRYLFNENPFPMWVFDPVTLRFLEVNKMAVRHYGYTSREFRTMTILDIRPQEDRTPLHDLVRNKNTSQTTFRRGKWTHVKKDGEKIIVEITSHRINYHGSEATLVQAQDVTERVKLERLLLEEKINHQREMAKAALDVQEKERTEIGKELHDNVNQILTSAKLQLEYMDQSTDKEKIRLNGIKLVNMAINEIRKLSKSLVPPSLRDIGLVASVHDLIEHINSPQTSIEFCNEGIDDSLDKGLQLTIFRIIQELTTNIIKYAEASSAQIKLHRINNSVMLSVSDDGKGFDLAKHRKGIGLNNIINRADIYRGKVSIRSEPGKGSKIVITFHLSAVADCRVSPVTDKRQPMTDER